MTQNNRSKLLALLSGLLVFALTLALAAVLSAPAAAQAETPPAETPPAVETTAVPKACADCHPNVSDAWSASPHAHAFDDPMFTAQWEANGEPGECLVCHTTSTGGAVEGGSPSGHAPGVTCESCHGAPDAAHPPAVVPARGDPAECGACHTVTYGEWRLTGHSSAGVGCVNCHNPHSQAALFEDPDEMCLNCHKDDLGSHQDDIHIAKGVGCVDCHALHLPPEQPRADGQAPTGHTFTISAATCVACHTDALGVGHALPGWETGASSQTETGDDPPLPELVATYTAPTGAGLAPAQQIQALEAALASTRLSTLFQGGIIGLVLGGTTAFFIARNTRRDEEPHSEVEHE